MYPLDVMLQGYLAIDQLDRVLREIVKNTLAMVRVKICLHYGPCLEI